MTIPQKLKHEAVEVGLAMLYFGTWIAALLLLKQLLLEEYDIGFHHWSMALIGALILSKVVLILRHVPLGAWFRARPAWAEVLVRTVLYSLGVLIVLLLEKGFDGRPEYGGFGPSLAAVFHHVDIVHVWANALCLSGAILVHNALGVVRRHLHDRTLIDLYLSPLPPEKSHPD